MLQHVLGLLTHPRQQWQNLRYQTADSTAEAFIGYLLLIAIIPPLSLAIGVTQWGWQNLDGTLIHMSLSNAVSLGIILYLLLLSCVVGIAFVMFQLERFAGGIADFERCLSFATLTASPLFFSGISGLIPVVWINVSLVLIAGLYSARLLLIGMPIFLDMTSVRLPILAGFISLMGLTLLALCAMIMLSFWRVL